MRKDRYGNSIWLGDDPIICFSDREVAEQANNDLFGGWGTITEDSDGDYQLEWELIDDWSDVADFDSCEGAIYYYKLYRKYKELSYHADGFPNFEDLIEDLKSRDRWGVL